MLTHDGRCLTGLPARIALFGNVRLLWPLALLARMPGLHQLLAAWFNHRRQRRIDSGSSGASLTQWRELQVAEQPQDETTQVPARQERATATATGS